MKTDMYSACSGTLVSDYTLQVSVFTTLDKLIHAPFIHKSQYNIISVLLSLNEVQKSTVYYCRIKQFGVKHKHLESLFLSQIYPLFPVIIVFT